MPHDTLIGIQKADFEMFEPLDRAHVADRYPHMEQMLVDRLGSAISRRRAALKYRERHHSKLLKGIDRAVDHQKVAVSTQLSDTIITQYEALHIDSDEESISGDSETSYSSSLLESVDQLNVPRLPKGSADRRPFQCPYCFHIITVQNRDAWIRHIFEDLKPYVYVFSDCPAPSRLYDSHREWHRHLQSKHASSLATGADIECPLRCGTMVSPRLLVRHLGRHLEDIALFALRRGESDDVEKLDPLQETHSASSPHGDYVHHASMAERETHSQKDKSLHQPVDMGTSDADKDTFEKLQAVDHAFRQTWLPLCEKFIKETITPSNVEQRSTKHRQLWEGMNTNVILEATAIDINDPEHLAFRKGLLARVSDILGVVGRAERDGFVDVGSVHISSGPSGSTNEDVSSDAGSIKEQGDFLTESHPLNEGELVTSRKDKDEDAWHCCECGNGASSGRFNTHCSHCHAQRCSNCSYDDPFRNGPELDDCDGDDNDFGYGSRVTRYGSLSGSASQTLLDRPSQALLGSTSEAFWGSISEALLSKHQRTSPQTAEDRVDGIGRTLADE
ncbi:hypothetical protein EDD36DRAFT_140886 [Exophiala viscosa]|uniref:Oxidoreductase acuF-like C2H2 type zinc-finger domain-containing protein n=1 Tax=Exophiala viscosa TaxID=2486360 RepID=A0AAN6E3E8_9EURO|nr:hypothetical protein EDD36DRAFT_140886 [Exophiala viscosa]